MYYHYDNAAYRKYAACVHVSMAIIVLGAIMATSFSEPGYIEEFESDDEEELDTRSNEEEMLVRSSDEEALDTRSEFESDEDSDEEALDARSDEEGLGTPAEEEPHIDTIHYEDAEITGLAADEMNTSGVKFRWTPDRYEAEIEGLTFLMSSKVFQCIRNRGWRNITAITHGGFNTVIEVENTSGQRAVAIIFHNNVLCEQYPRQIQQSIRVMEAQRSGKLSTELTVEIYDIFRCNVPITEDPNFCPGGNMYTYVTIERKVDIMLGHVLHHIFYWSKNIKLFIDGWADEDFNIHTYLEEMITDGWAKNTRWKNRAVFDNAFSKYKIAWKRIHSLVNDIVPMILECNETANKLMSQGWIHDDLHLGNWGMINGNVVLIDLDSLVHTSDRRVFAYNDIRLDWSEFDVYTKATWKKNQIMERIDNGDETAGDFDDYSDKEWAEHERLEELYLTVSEDRWDVLNTLQLRHYEMRELSLVFRSIAGKIDKETNAYEWANYLTRIIHLHIQAYIPDAVIVRTEYITPPPRKSWPIEWRLWKRIINKSPIARFHVTKKTKTTVTEKAATTITSETAKKVGTSKKAAKIATATTTSKTAKKPPEHDEEEMYQTFAVEADAIPTHDRDAWLTYVGDAVYDDLAGDKFKNMHKTYETWRNRYISERTQVESLNKKKKKRVPTRRTTTRASRS